MTNNTSGINKEIKVNGQKLQTVTSFRYPGSVVSDEDSKPGILSRIAQTTTLTRSSHGLQTDFFFFGHYVYVLCKSMCVLYTTGL